MSNLPEIYPLSPRNSDEGEGVAMVWGNIEDLQRLEAGPLVRPHSRCLYGDVFGSCDCDCRDQLDTMVGEAEEKGGILFYLAQQEGRGLGLEAKAKGYGLTQAKGLNTHQAYTELGLPFDTRQYGHCARWLLAHSIGRVQMATNNLRKIAAFRENGIVVTRRSLLIVRSDNVDYLRAKRNEDGHLLPPDL
jgi:GTP cyclohydrolase II